MRITVFGAGSFGTALAYKAAVNGDHHTVTMLTRNEVVRDGINIDRVNPDYLVGANYKMPENVSATSDVEEALRNVDLIVHTIPMQSSFEYLRAKKDFIPRDCPIVSASKGIHSETLCFMSDVIPDALENPDQPTAFFSGPSFAKELVENQPTAVTIASVKPEIALLAQEVFHSPILRLYTTDDVIGTELGGSLKNVYAIAAGVADSLGFGLNSTAAMVTRGCNEMTRLAVRLGGRQQTLAGLSGVGDLVLTCYGKLSRNRTVGVRLGKGETLAEIIATSKEVAEGIPTTSAASRLARKLDLDCPIIFAAEALLKGEKDARLLVQELLERPPTEEHVMPETENNAALEGNTNTEESNK